MVRYKTTVAGAGGALGVWLEELGLDRVHAVVSSTALCPSPVYFDAMVGQSRASTASASACDNLLSAIRSLRILT